MVWTWRKATVDHEAGGDDTQLWKMTGFKGSENYSYSKKFTQCRIKLKKQRVKDKDKCT